MSSRTPVLAVRRLSVRYGSAVALDGVDLDVGEGQVVAVVGGNGAGKSTLLRTISALPEPGKRVGGTVELDGRPIGRWAPHRVAVAGVVQVPEGRRIFPALSVEDNLLLGGYRRRRQARPTGGLAADVGTVFERFPVLGARRRQLAGHLSGGEQQMLAIGRALMARPRVLLLDEPSLGLAPIVVDEVYAVIADLAREGTTILLVEQLANLALGVADRAWVLEAGRVVRHGAADDLRADPAVRAAYLGGP